VWFLPITQDPFDTAKFFLLIGAALFAAGVWLLGGLAHFKLRIISLPH
jgi:hypothetical protein